MGEKRDPHRRGLQGTGRHYINTIGRSGRYGPAQIYAGGYKEESMQEYQIKRGFKDGLEERMISSLTEFFGVAPEERDGHHVISFGALKRLDVCLGPKGSTVLIDTESDLSADDETILDTNRRFRRYLDAVTGYNSKERAKKMQK